MIRPTDHLTLSTSIHAAMLMIGFLSNSNLMPVSLKPNKEPWLLQVTGEKKKPICFYSIIITKFKG